MITLCFNIIGDNSSAFWTMMSFFALVISFFFLIRQIKIQNDANKISFIETSEQRWRSYNFIKARQKVCAKTSTRIDIEEETILSFFEDLGILYKKKIIDLDIIWEKFSYYIEHYWIILESNIKQFQTEQDDITWFQNFENLQHKIYKYSKKKTNKKDYKISEDDLKKFRDSEKDQTVPNKRS